MKQIIILIVTLVVCMTVNAAKLDMKPLNLEPKSERMKDLGDSTGKPRQKPSSGSKPTGEKPTGTG